MSITKKMKKIEHNINDDFIVSRIRLLPKRHVRSISLEFFKNSIKRGLKAYKKVSPEDKYLKEVFDCAKKYIEKSTKKNKGNLEYHYENLWYVAESSLAINRGTVKGIVMEGVILSIKRYVEYVLNSKKPIKNFHYYYSTISNWLSYAASWSIDDYSDIDKRKAATQREFRIQERVLKKIIKDNVEGKK